MQDDKRGIDTPEQSLPLVDLAYLFGSAPAPVRHNPHIRQQAICAPMDLLALSAMIRSRDTRR